MAKTSLLSDIPFTMLSEFTTQDERGTLLTLRVKPGANVDKLSLYGVDELVLLVKAPSIENAANDRVVMLVAELFNVAKSSVEIISGHKSRLKRILIKNYKR